MQEGKLKILVQIAGRKNPDLDKLNVDWVMDVIPPERRNLFAMVNPMIDMARPYFAPPDIPAARTAILREAFAALARDTAFNDEVEKVANIHAAYLPGADMTKAIAEMLDQPADIKEKVIGLLRSSAN